MTQPASPTCSILGFCAHGSGAGKTTLLTQLIPQLLARGMRVSVIKHAHHDFDIDQPGKDSYRLREAGAVQMMVASRQRWALVTELQRSGQAGAEAELAPLLAQMDTRLVDLVLVEGFRHEALAKLEVYRAELGKPLLAAQDASIIAVASDTPLDIAVPRLDLNDISAIADFVIGWHQARQPIREHS